MATVRNRVVKGKKKKSAGKAGKANGKLSAARKAKLVDSRVTGFNLPKFSNDILEHRHYHGLTQRELGAKCGMTSACVVFIENARSAPLVQNFAKLCQFFKLKPDTYITIK